MPDENQPAPVNQSAVGNENIQVAGSHNVIQRITNFIQGDTEQQRAQRNRQAMLELVKNTWVKGVLEKSLYHEMLIQLGMEERPVAVEHPWDLTVQMPDKPNRTLPPDTRIIDVFDESNRALLVLGEPGSGKTTMLLELARDSIDRAEKDPTQPIPVVFNLSAWSDSKRSIQDWLIAELVTKYLAPKQVASTWVKNDELLPLLDGLDEVDVVRREACVQAINDFRAGHGLAPLVVCSRIADYEALNSKLTLRDGVLLQPLTYQQVDQYLRKSGLTFSALRNSVRDDATLQELAQSPLMLSIMMLAYQDTPPGELSDDLSESIEARRERIFDNYVQRMFQRVGRTPHELYSKEKTLRWLTWLAEKMTEHSQTMFLAERLRRSWLESRSQQILHMTLVVLVVGLVFGLDYGLVFGPVVGLVGGVFFGLIFGLVGENEPSEILKWSWREGIRALVRGIPTDLVLGLVGGLVVGLVWGLVVGLIFGLVAALGGGLYDLLTGGLKPAPMEIHMIPNQGIRRSIKNAANIWLVAGLGGGLVVGLVVGLVSALVAGLGGGLVGGVFFGLIFGLRYGGHDVLQHYVLRLILYCNGSMPLNYVRFLDYAADRIFLRKVGGGYIFAHRLLQEHFAAMNTETPRPNK